MTQLAVASLGAHVLEKLPTELPAGPESWERDRIKAIRAERGFSRHTGPVGAPRGTVLRKAAPVLFAQITNGFAL